MMWIFIVILALIIILMAGHEESKIKKLNDKLEKLDKEELEIERKIDRIKESVNHSIIHE